MHYLGEKTIDELIDMQESLIKMDTEATFRSIFDLIDKDDIIKLDAYKLWGINPVDNTLEEEWEPPFCITENGRNQYIDYRHGVFMAINSEDPEKGIDAIIDAIKQRGGRNKNDDVE